ncbi:MAG: hypothetical protein ABSB25_02860 [Sedimentisphaerales bacterium]|jgi:hypothetical protein
MQQEHQIPIWFFIGLLLLIYGVLIFGYGIYNLICPPEHPVKLANLHADLWWGILLLVIGLIYVVKYRPSKKQR